jgi:hypothetical protein
MNFGSHLEFELNLEKENELKFEIRRMGGNSSTMGQRPASRLGRPKQSCGLGALTSERECLRGAARLVAGRRQAVVDGVFRESFAEVLSICRARFRRRRCNRAMTRREGQRSLVSGSIPVRKAVRWLVTVTMEFLRTHGRVRSC